MTQQDDALADALDVAERLAAGERYHTQMMQMIEDGFVDLRGIDPDRKSVV